MSDHDFTTVITVSQSPEQAFAAVNNVRGWWSQDIRGGTEKAGDIFNYRFRDLHRCTIKVKEAVPGKRVVWHVLDNWFSFTKDETEWKGTNVVFDIAEVGGKTEVRVTHEGLTPEYECFDICSDGWTTYIQGSLKALIETGKGNPNVGEPMNESEKVLSL